MKKPRFRDEGGGCELDPMICCQYTRRPCSLGSIRPSSSQRRRPLRFPAGYKARPLRCTDTTARVQQNAAQTPSFFVIHWEGFEPGQLSSIMAFRFDAAMRVLLGSSLLAILSFSVFVAAAGDFYQGVDVTWGDGRGKILDNGQLLTLSLDKASGSGFQSRNEYLFGKIDMQIKLVPGNSAGTVTAYYLSSQGPTHDEIDFEFLGNLSGDPYTLHTNVFSQGKGNREQQFKLWFDPTADFHTYSILWNPQHIIFSVDGTPIRDFRNNEARGVAFPKNQPMRIYSSLWNADDWATRGGLVKTDWSKAPFVASYRGFNAADACVVSAGGASSCGSKGASAPGSGNSAAWWNQELDATSQERMRWVQKNYMIYNYCTDVKRFSQGLPTECTIA